MTNSLAVTRFYTKTCAHACAASGGCACGAPGAAWEGETTTDGERNEYGTAAPAPGYAADVTYCRWVRSRSAATAGGAQEGVHPRSGRQRLPIMPHSRQTNG